MAVETGQKRDTIVLGASAGGIEALRRVLGEFEATLDATVLVVQHTPADGRSLLAGILQGVTGLRVTFAEDGETILPRHVYVAPPDRHLLVDRECLRLWHGPRENNSRPAIDPLFRSAAVSRRGRVIGAVLSGLLDDGSAGLVAVKRCGGLAYVQAPADALEGEMPERAAWALGDALDGSMAAKALGRRLVELIGSSAPGASAPPDLKVELEMLLGQVRGIEELSEQGPPLPLSCPECGGPLWSVRDHRLQRFRCHTGHSYGTQSLLSAQGRQIEQALWAAIKGLEQRSQVLENLAADEVVRRRPASAHRLSAEASDLVRHAQTLRDVLVASFREMRPKG